jgi:hypothetical protein
MVQALARAIWPYTKEDLGQPPSTPAATRRKLDLVEALLGCAVGLLQECGGNEFAAKWLYAAADGLMAKPTDAHDASEANESEGA